MGIGTLKNRPKEAPQLYLVARDGRRVIEEIVIPRRCVPTISRLVMHGDPFEYSMSIGIDTVKSIASICGMHGLDYSLDYSLRK